MLPFAKYKNKTTYANFVRTILPSWVTKCKARAEGWMLKKRKFYNWAEVAGGKIRLMFAFSTKIVIFVSEKYGIRRNTRPPMPV